MAVLMSYHKLVERDSKHIGYCWKYLTIIILAVAIVCCIVGSWSMHKLVRVYDERCILDANVKFTQKDRTVPSFDDFPDFDNTQIDVTDIEPSQLIIDETATKWGSSTKCDYAVFIPIFQLCFGIIITVMFIICGKGGRDETSFLPQPWRIVAPAAIFFLAMTILSIVNLTNVTSGLNTFCASFGVFAPAMGCISAMNMFVINADHSVLQPSILYILVTMSTWTLAICFSALLTIMIARIVFVVDFQLVRVTIKTCEGGNEKACFKVLESPDDGKDGNEC